jgi:hypothetical protein
LANSDTESQHLTTAYAKSLNLPSIPVASTTLALKFLSAEQRFVAASDAALTSKLTQSNWLKAMQDANVAEDALIAKIESQRAWNQFAMGLTAFASGAALGATSAATGTTYSPASVMNMGVSIGQSFNQADAANLANAYNIYQTALADTKVQMDAVRLGLSEVAEGVNFTTLEQIREVARRKLAGP